jgi:hypothetical protein
MTDAVFRPSRTAFSTFASRLYIPQKAGPFFALVRSRLRRNHRPGFSTLDSSRSSACKLNNARLLADIPAAAEATAAVHIRPPTLWWLDTLHEEAHCFLRHYIASFTWLPVNDNVVSTVYADAVMPVFECGI